jgi:hypothetical protein
MIWNLSDSTLQATEARGKDGTFRQKNDGICLTIAVFRKIAKNYSRVFQRSSTLLTKLEPRAT